MNNAEKLSDSRNSTGEVWKKFASEMNGLDESTATDRGITEKDARADDTIDEASEQIERYVENPAERFRLDEHEFPIFCQQEEIPKKGEMRVLTINETASRFVTDTADAIAVIAGDSAPDNKEKPTQFDHVIYLDKSARPIKSLVEAFWGDFADGEPPEASFLAIDRAREFNKAGISSTVDGRLAAGAGSDESGRMLTFEDYKPVDTPEFLKHIASIRGLYLKNGVDPERADYQTIMETPSKLDGKNVLVVDEVSRSGSTHKIAKYLVQRAFPDANVQTYIYWEHGKYRAEDERRDRHGDLIEPAHYELCSTPIWYERPYSDTGGRRVGGQDGRGVHDPDDIYYKTLYEQEKTPENFAKYFAKDVLGVPFEDDAWRELQREIQLLKQEFDAGHILMTAPKHYDRDKWFKWLEDYNIVAKKDKNHLTFTDNNLYFKVRSAVYEYIPEEETPRT